MRAIIHGKLILDTEIVEGKILLFQETIVEVVDTMPRGVTEVIDAQGCYVSAGFIDLHIHGSGGADVMDATPEALETISSILPATGTTAFLATTMTMAAVDIQKALENVQKYACDVTGAAILGVHLEGPFINAQRHGAQDKTFVQQPNFSLIAPYMDVIKMITLAPEVEGSEAFIRKIKEQYPDVCLSIGHSSADYAQTKQSFEWGISHATHLFNAMSPYHHRSPNIVGAVFDSEVSCDVIADLVHLHPSVLDLVHKVKRDKLLLVTDAMRAGCMRCGTYDLGGRKVEVSDGKALLEDGTLAGSVLKMNQALHTMVTHTSMTLLEAVESVTRLPAKILGVKKGRLAAGYDADIVIFDKDFSMMSTFILGNRTYQRI